MNPSVPCGSETPGFNSGNMPWASQRISDDGRDRRHWTVAEACARGMEILIAVFVLIVASPVMLITALVIKLDSRGPVLFRQIRVGRNGRLFTFYKFRTLYVNARELYPELYRYDYTPEELENLPVKRERDPRVTRVGRWLRVSTIDELPNFWNLLKGDVALVGPRADVPEMLRNYLPDEMVKFSVKPGITGLAQIRGRGRLKFREMNRYDVEYVQKKNFWLDCHIVFETAKLVIRMDSTF